MMLRWVIVLTFLGSVSTKCSRDETVEAAKVAEQVSRAAINTDEWSDGETATIRCKNYTKAYSWANSIRSIKGVEITQIDEFDSSTNQQKGQIVVKCSGATFVPDIFTGQDTWCKLGCNPIPEDAYHYWKAKYPSTAVTTDKRAAPINMNTNVYVEIGCRDGYTRKNNDNGALVSKCDEVGWIEPLSGFPTCVPGCPDKTTTINNRISLNTKRADTDAPFVTGDTIEFYCQTGYTLLGNSTITCTSLNAWDSEPPACVSEGYTAKTSALLLAVLAVFYAL